VYWTKIAVIVAAVLVLSIDSLAGSRATAVDDRIALSTKRSINTISPTGAGIRTVSEDSSDDAAWAPDHSAIAAIAVAITIYGLDGSKRELPAAGEQTNPSWSPNGKKIAFSMIHDLRCHKLHVRGKCPNEIYVIDADGSNLRRITDGRDAGNGHYAPAWSPDGQRIVYSAYEGWAAGLPQRLRKESRIMMVNASGGKSKLVLTLPFPYHADDLDWSQANNRIVFSYMHGSGIFRENPVIKSKIAVVRPDGTGLRDLTSFAAGRADDPAWSPNGKQIAFIGHLNRDPQYSWFAYVLTPASGAMKKLIPAESLDW
jgi:Tol biopolymer transport system component